MEKHFLTTAQETRMSKSKVKVMLIAFFDIREIVHVEFMPHGLTIKQSIYNKI